MGCVHARNQVTGAGDGAAQAAEKEQIHLFELRGQRHGESQSWEENKCE